MALQIETVNGTAWSSLKVWLEQTAAHVALAQETKVLQDAVDEVSAWALHFGWKSLWAPARLTERE
eukprot:11392501-Karenia_brevis.AAC.1